MRGRVLTQAAKRVIEKRNELPRANATNVLATSTFLRASTARLRYNPAGAAMALGRALATITLCCWPAARYIKANGQLRRPARECTDGEAWPSTEDRNRRAKSLHLVHHQDCIARYAHLDNKDIIVSWDQAGGDRCGSLMIKLVNG
jgi:hypothetical protein